MAKNILIVNSTTTHPVLLHADVEPCFDLILFNYYGEDPDLLRSHWQSAGFSVYDIITHKTECKGQIFHVLAAYDFDCDYISLWDHDLETNVSVINTLFELGSKNDWHWFQPSLRPGSYNSFLWTMDYSFPEYLKEGKDCTYTLSPFVEQMCPFFSGRLWQFLRPLFNHYNYFSGYGLDIYWIPEVLSVFQPLTFPVVIKSVSINHTKAIESNGVRYSNGLTAGEEMDRCSHERYRLVSELYTAPTLIDVQCISLDDPLCDGRKKRFQASAEQYNLDFEFFPAVDLRGLTRYQYPDWIPYQGRRIDWYEPLKSGEAGVAASHKYLYEQAFQDPELNALVIFEDDALIIKNLDELMVPEDADLLMLSSRWHHNKRGEVVGQSCGFEGYVITRRGMYKMLQILEHMDMPIDLIAIAHCRSMIQSQHGLTTLRNVLNPVLNIYHRHNYCIAYDEGVSTIKTSSS